MLCTPQSVQFPFWSGSLTSMVVVGWWVEQQKNPSRLFYLNGTASSKQKPKRTIRGESEPSVDGISGTSDVAVCAINIINKPTRKPSTWMGLGSRFVLVLVERRWINTHTSLRDGFNGWPIFRNRTQTNGTRSRRRKRQLREELFRLTQTHRHVRWYSFWFFLFFFVAFSFCDGAWLVSPPFLYVYVLVSLFLPFLCAGIA